jgi:hypothetical protein
MIPILCGPGLCLWPLVVGWILWYYGFLDQQHITWTVDISPLCFLYIYCLTIYNFISFIQNGCDTSDCSSRTLTVDHSLIVVLGWWSVVPICRCARVPSRKSPFLYQWSLCPMLVGILCVPCYSLSAVYECIDVFWFCRCHRPVSCWFHCFPVYIGGLAQLLSSVINVNYH